MDVAGRAPVQNGPNLCVTCGACCALYRASFYWAEADDCTPGAFPADLTEKLNDFFRVIRGTNQKNPWCIALSGVIGAHVACTEYDRRPSPCRDFPPSWETGEANERCDAARRHWGLEPLRPEDWFSPELPRAA